MPTMRLVRLTCVLAILALSLAGCGSGLRKSVFPPRASIQQLAQQADGSWKLQLRLQNFSDVPMSFAKVDAKIEIAGSEAGSVSVSPAIRVGPDSADLFEASLKAAPSAAAKVTALHGDGNVRYKMRGRIVTTDPAGDYPYEFEGQLSPVPGMDGVLR
jgi:hypothetical protein